MRMDRKLALRIACDALNPHIDTVLRPIPDDEQLDISKALKNIEDKNPEELNDIVRVIVKESKAAGYDTSINPPALLRCDVMGDLVTEIRNSSSKS